MTQPAVNITEQDGALGVLPPSAGRLLAVVGVASQGPINQPATYARVKDLTGTFGVGPAVEAAAHYIDQYGRAVLFIRTEQSEAGASSTVESTGVGDGTSVVTVKSGSAPLDDQDLVLAIVNGGTVGTPAVPPATAITYQLSYDGGRNWGTIKALGGTALEVVVPDSGVTFALSAGTINAGAQFATRSRAPNWSGEDLLAALNALEASIVNWEICHVVGPLDEDAFDNVETKFQSMFARGKFHSWIGNTRTPDQGETEAEYLAALSPLSAAKATVRGSLYAGACRLTSSVTGRKYRRPVAFATAAREQSVTEEVDIADVNLGPLAGVSIRDVNGNPDPDCHDESLYPGLDDLRFAVLRTWDGLSGVYVNRPRIFSPDGSDFQLMPHRRVLDLAEQALRLYFIRRLNKPIRVNKTTGYILEAEALEIEGGALAAMASLLLAKPKASGVQFALSRFDNVLSTKTLTGTARVIPLAYPEQIDLDVGFFNPALVVQAA